jgi:hypothetical protein
LSLLAAMLERECRDYDEIDGPLAQQISSFIAMAGRIQRQVRRCLIAAAGPVQFSVLDWAYAGDRRQWRWPIYQILKRWGVNVGRGLWAPNTELARLIRGE